jgi:hypothetical protein
MNEFPYAYAPMLMKSNTIQSCDYT